MDNIINDHIDAIVANLKKELKNQPELLAGVDPDSISLTLHFGADNKRILENEKHQERGFAGNVTSCMRCTRFGCFPC